MLHHGCFGGGWLVGVFLGGHGGGVVGVLCTKA